MRGSPQRQSGLALIAMLTLLGIWGLHLLLGQLSATQFRLENEQNAAATLAEARAALLGDAIGRLPVSDAAYLRLPDLGSNAGSVTEGQASATFTGEGKDLTVIGKFPWRTLGTTVLRDEQGECLWYVLSGRFKNSTPALKTDVLNWDTLGQIDVVDRNSNLIASNLAALLVAPGRALDNQDRALADATYAQCGGNYDARNYLDAFNSANFISGFSNYFAASINNRAARFPDNKTFVMARTDFYNDGFLFVTVDDIFDPLIGRSDFAGAVATLLDDPSFRSHLQSIVVSGNKGSDNVNCRCNNPTCTLVAGGGFQTFCANWKEMLFLTELPAPAAITIDGAASGNCSRVLIFAGRKAGGQTRSSFAEKANPNNYLEAPNVTSFSVPSATSANFTGASAFSSQSPATDVVRCLP